MNFFLFSQYVKYLLKAQNRKGHGIHSPFIYQLIREVLMNKHQPHIFESIEGFRAVWKFDKTKIEINDFGAGSKKIKTKYRKISDIATTSLTNKKHSQLLYKIASFYQPKTILELGTSLGITTSYLSSACPQAEVHTIEACNSIATCAKETVNRLNKKNITIHTGTFSKTLPQLLPHLKIVDLVYIDGNHTKEATLFHLESILAYTNKDSIIIFDDIYWSKDMSAAWQAIKAHPSISLTVDVFQFGICFRKEGVAKQNFTVKF